MRLRTRTISVPPMTHTQTLPASAASATAALRRALRLADHLDAVSQVHSRDHLATNDVRDGLVWSSQIHVRRDADVDAIVETLRGLAWVADVKVYRFTDGEPMFVSTGSHAWRRGADRRVTLVAEPASDTAPALDEPATVEPELVEAVEAAVAPVAIHANREAWLTAAVDAVRPLFAQLADVELPADVRVSCGFPGGKSPAKVIGQCWYTADDGAAQVFVSPILVDPVDVLGVLVHELVHAWDRGKSGHKAAFAKVAKAVGLVGKMTSTTVGDELRPVLVDVAAELGAYPHARLNLAAAGVAKQSTRMLKVECPSCGYTLRTTAKWLEVGVPTCPCGSDMEAAA